MARSELRKTFFDFLRKKVKFRPLAELQWCRPVARPKWMHQKHRQAQLLVSLFAFSGHWVDHRYRKLRSRFPSRLTPIVGGVSRNMTFYRVFHRNQIEAIR